jgi:carbon-monoxide dehydrogenase medium subunit
MREHSGNVLPIAGGTDVIPQLRAGSISPRHLVDLSKLPLDQIEVRQDHVRLGARVTQAMVLESRELIDKFPVLGEACRVMAGPTIRNRATLGGNLANASPAADSAPPLIVYDAQVILKKVGSQRALPLEKLFTGPGETVIEPDELLTEVRIPILAPNSRAKFIKLGIRSAMAIAVASVAVRLTFDQDQKIKHARIALGSVAPTPLRSITAEKVLEGEKPSRTLFDEAARKAEDSASPISDIRASAGYRKKMVNVLVTRCLNLIWDQFGEERS